MQFRLKRMKILLILFLFIFDSLFITVQAKNVFRWFDDDGKVHFSDRYRKGAKRLEIHPGQAYLNVQYVYDGDTVLLSDKRKVRLLGINTPEVEGRNKVQEAGAEEAKNWLEQVLKFQRVRLESDTESKDKYGRTLAYLITEQDLHINLELVRLGLATLNIHPPNLKYLDDFQNAQNQAESMRLGIWGLLEYQPLKADQIGKKNYKGWRRVVGKASAIRKSRKYVYLEVNKRFNARIAKKNLIYFPEMKSYLHKKIEFRGWMNRNKDKFSMLIRHPSALKSY